MNRLSFACGALFAACLAFIAPAQAQGQAPRTGHNDPIFVLNSLDANVSVIDPVTYKEVRRIPTGKEPHHLYFSPDQKSLIVANSVGDTLTLLDPRTAQVQRTLTGIVDPYQLRFSPDMKWFVTAANRLNHIDIYQYVPSANGFDLKLMKRVPAGKTPSHIGIDSKSTTAYVSLQDSDEVIAIDLATQQVRWTLPVGKTPADVYIVPGDKVMLVALTGDSYVEAYDLTSPGKPKLITRIKTNGGAHAFRVQGDGQHIFVSNRAANTISRIDFKNLKVVAEYPAPGGPDCMDLMADGKTLLVTSRWARKLTFIDIDKKEVVRQINVGRSPHGVWTLDHVSMH
ncbi:YVTN family beta-propeller repeat protein [Bordetella sp. H567]|uniref:YVTN family beta-propeller repeat protein n=1 Tax=Bordetella sp. H567 TaxID=1697043 RepID=UPI000B10AC4C|nr:selenium-binding protein SBP56-related protein [Bordetella sp. H567]